MLAGTGPSALVVQGLGVSGLRDIRVWGSRV